LNDEVESGPFAAPVATKELRQLPGCQLLLVAFPVGIALEALIPHSCHFRMSVIQFLQFIEKPMFRSMFYIWAIFMMCPLASLFICVSVCGYQCWLAKRRS
jgi:hypothetical protein